MLTVKKIVKEYLEKNGYDGLFYDDCSCYLEDLIPCGENFEWCQPGYVGACICGEGCDHHIYGTKADAMVADAERALAEKVG